MRDRSLRVLVGFLLIGFQIMLLPILLWSYRGGGLKFPELTTTLAIVLPMLATHTVVAVEYFIRHRHKVGRSRRVTAPYAVISILFPICFFGALYTLIFMNHYTVLFESFDQFKWALGAAEMLFGVYVAKTAASLFGGTPSD
ncbi:hypothetical protein ACFL09_02850 [Planctomycetota bacterium]